VAATEIEICNLALSNIRSLKFIEALTEDNNEAIACNLHYARTRDLALRRADWPFARKRLALIASGTPPDEWGYSYALPADCLRVRGVQDGMRVRSFDATIKYAIENDGTGSGRVILMDIPDAVLIYTMRVTDTTVFDDDFAEALTWKLAANICRPLDKDAQVCAQTLQIAEEIMGRAVARAYNEQKPDAQPESDFYTTRLN